ncbi:MAG TPA: ArsR family transcriptional regulator [Edaphobacter sp.]|nr:ArsR family transcriptional regulator [Edaphobacter sp.]
MDGAGRNRGDCSRHLVRALTHPLRIRILQALVRGAAGVEQLAVLTGEPLGQVDYHLRILRDCRWVDVVETRSAAGAGKSTYRARPEAAEGLKHWELVPLLLREEIAEAFLNGLSSDVVGALQAKIQRREGPAVIRMEIVVDQTGWQELSDLFGDQEGPIRGVAARSAERLRTAKGTALEVLLAAFESDGAEEEREK